MNFIKARAVREDNGIDLQIGAAKLLAMPAPDRLPDNGEVIAGIRPERIGLMPASEAGVAASVELVEPTGVATVVHVSIAGQQLKLFTTERLQLAGGQPVSLAIKPADVCLFDPADGERLRLPK